MKSKLVLIPILFFLLFLLILPTYSKAQSETIIPFAQNDKPRMVYGPNGMGYPGKINVQKQNKHIPGTAEYMSGRSIFKGTAKDAQKLLDNWGGRGKGQWVNDYKERIYTNQNVGTHIDPATGIATLSKDAMIIYSKTGAHIYPIKPVR